MFGAFLGVVPLQVLVPGEGKVYSFFFRRSCSVSPRSVGSGVEERRATARRPEKNLRGTLLMGRVNEGRVGSESSRGFPKKSAAEPQPSESLV